MAAVDIFADAGILAYQDGVLDQALAELSVRLDLAGAGPLLEQLMAQCFCPGHADGTCQLSKRPPGDPHPKPKPPPKPDRCNCATCIATRRT